MYRVLASTVVTLALVGQTLAPTTVLAASRSSKNVAYVTYNDTGFQGTGPAQGNIFATSVVGGPAPTSLATTPVSFNGITFTPLARSALSSATLAPFDTLILFEVCDIGTSLSAAQHQVINDYLAAGNKILLYDADRCAPGVGGVADYSWFQFPFKTSSPGPRGASATLQVVEASSLTQGLASDPFNLDELGDANTATTSDRNWFAAAKTTNALGNNGFFLAYARNRGLIIYDGADHWFSDVPTKSLTDLIVNELNQQYDPDNLPSTTPLAGRTLMFVHGINQSFAEIQASLAATSGLTPDPSFTELFKAYGPDNIVVFRHYQDRGYGQGTACAVPAPDTNTAPLFVPFPAPISGTICDSKGALAYSASNLDDELTGKSVQTPTAVLGYSMGGAIIRGWLALAQQRNSASMKVVDTVVTFQGAHQGSVWAVIGDAALFGLSAVPEIGGLLVATATTLAAAQNFDPTRPAVQDLTPLSPWYFSVNPAGVPSGLHYYNMYSDIQVKVHTQFFGDTIPLGGTSFGDLAMLPGDPNPKALPILGGARFLPNGAATDRHEWTASSSHDFDLGDLLNDPRPAVGSLLADPAQHLNLNQNLNTGSVLIASCKAGAAQVRPLIELLRALTSPANAC
ncbi:MAG: hypothetical protein M3069_11960 [Chloroflexota bacterium]|nr:hypothetical protein [Chloroflexota bacterium]